MYSLSLRITSGIKIAQVNIIFFVICNSKNDIILVQVVVVDVFLWLLVLGYKLVSADYVMTR